MERLLRMIDRTTDLIGKIASSLAMVLTLVIFYDVLMRYLFAKPTLWAYDTTIMIFGVYAAIGAAYCHYRKGHVRMDLLHERLSTRGKATVDMICYLFLFFPLLIILTYKIGEHSIWSLTHGERASASSWRPPLAPFKMLITLGFLLFLAQGVADFVRTVVCVFKGGDYDA